MAIRTANLTVTSSYTNVVAPADCAELSIRSRSSDNTGGYYIQDPTSGNDHFVNDGELFTFGSFNKRIKSNEVAGRIKSANAGPFTFDLKAVL